MSSTGTFILHFQYGSYFDDAAFVYRCEMHVVERMLLAAISMLYSSYAVWMQKSLTWLKERERDRERVKRSVVCMRNLESIPPCLQECNTVMLGGSNVGERQSTLFSSLRLMASCGSLPSYVVRCVPTTCLFDKCANYLCTVVTLPVPHDAFNLLKPTGHVMHHQFNIQQLYALPTLYLCVLYLSENKQRLVPLTA